MIIRRSHVSLHISFAAAVGLAFSAASATGSGFRDIEGVHVGSGTETLSGSFISAPEGEFVKTGAGTLQIPMSAIDHSTPYSVNVAGGKLQLTGAVAEGSAVAPDFVTEKAAFWVDATDLTTGNGVAVWSDKRSGGAWSAAVQYLNATEETPPVVLETNGVKGVYFGGRSGKWMRFQKNGANADLSGVQHFFLVHGVFDWWSAVIGNVSTSRGAGILTTTDGNGSTVAYPDFETVGERPSMFVYRGDLDYRHFAARFFLDGTRVDPYSTPPRYGFQLFEGDMLTAPTTYNAFYRKMFETFKEKETAGGDFLCEAIVFSCRLTEEERLAVQRYLMNKWNLPQSTVGAPVKANRTTVRQLRKAGMVRTAAGAETEISVDAGAESVPLTFAGAGSVVKKGEGTMVLGPGDGVPGEGTFTLEEGDLLLRGGSMPPLTVAAGEIWDASRYPVADRPGTGDTSDAKIGSDMSAGIRISKETAAGSSAVEKTGTAELIVGAVADGVERLAVSDGTLHLTARQKCVSEPVAMDDDFEVYIPNHSFETPFGAPDGANRRYKWPSSTFNGWTKSDIETWNGVQFVTMYPKITTWTSYDFPDGTNALLIVGDGDVSTKVTVPKAGTYELSFWATSRYGNPIGQSENSSITRGVVDVKFDGRTVGRCQVNKGGFAKYRCRFSVAEDEAGNVKPLTLAAFQGYSDSCTVVDDLHMRAVPIAERTDTVKVPGGDFEMNDRVAVDGVRPSGFPCVYDRNMCVEGWEFSLTDDALSDNPTNGYVSVVSAATLSWHSGAYRTPFFSWAEGLPGASALSFLGDYGIARSGEFTLPAGRWLLRAKKAFRPACVFHLNPDTGKWGEYHHDYQRTELQVYATLERGSGEYALGLSANNEPNPYRPSCMLLPCVWTNVIEVSQDETVRLKLYGKNDGSALLDDFEFVPASGAMPEINLIENPGFELRGADWASVIPPGDVKYAASTPSYRFPYQTDTYAFGYSVYEGEYCGRLHNRGGVYRTVLFPEPGLYRFTYHARSRSDETYGFNPVFAYVVLADGTTNTVCRTKIPRGQNFVEYSYLFRMPEAGLRTFYIIGEGVPSGNLTEDGKDKANKSTLIDGLSLVKVDESSLAAPQVPERLRMSVAENARLVLDYPGTKTVASLTLGGELVTGYTVVNAESHPEYVSGIGSLTVKPFGTAVIIR